MGLIAEFSSVAQSCPTLCDPMNRSTPGLPVHHQLRSSLKLMSIESVMPSSHLILCRPLLLLPPIPPSIKVFSNESTLHKRWPKYWSFSFSIFPSKEHPRLISFRMDWLGFLAVKGTLKSLLQHHSSKASILQRSAFFTVQLSHPYMTTRITIALTRQTFVGRVMSLPLNMLSRLVITFLPRSKRLLISWLQPPSAAPRINSDCFHCFPIYLPWSNGTRSNQFILKEISPGCSLEGLMLKLKLQYSGHLMQRVDSLEKTLMLGGIEGRRRRGWQRMRWLDGITDLMDMSLSKLREWSDLWGRKESDMTEQQNWTELNLSLLTPFPFGNHKIFYVCESVSVL